MNLQELSKNIRLNEELARDAEMLESIRAKAYAVSSPALTGMPHGTGVTQKTEAFAVEIADLETRIAYLKTAIDLEKQALSEYCSGIEDMKIRTAFRLRFVHCMSWAEVADAMGKYYSESSVKTLCYTYLQRNP